MDLFDIITEFSELDKDILREKQAFEDRLKELTEQWMTMKKSAMAYNDKPKMFNTVDFERFKEICPHFTEKHKSEDLQVYDTYVKCTKCISRHGYMLTANFDKDKDKEICDLHTLLIKQFVHGLVDSMCHQLPPRLYAGRGGWCYNLGYVADAFKKNTTNYYKIESEQKHL